MKRSLSNEEVNEPSKRTKPVLSSMVPTTMAIDLEEFVPGLITKLESNEFTIMAIAESSTGKSEFLSRIINDMWGFGPDHASLLPTNLKKQFMNCTKVPIVVRHSDEWKIRLISGGCGVKLIAGYDGLSDDEVFTKIQTELKALNEKYDDSTASYIEVTGPFGNMPSYLVLIDMPIMVHELNPVFHLDVDAVLTFARGPLSTGAMCNMFNSLKTQRVPMTIFVHDLSPTIDIPSSVKALTGLLPDRFSALDLRVETRLDILQRTKDFTRMFQTFTIVHRDRPWNAYHTGVRGWVSDLRLKSWIDEIEEEFHSTRLLSSSAEFPIENQYITKFTGVYVTKEDLVEAVRILCFSKIDGKYAFLKRIRTLMLSFGQTCIYDVALQWVNVRMIRSALLDELVRDTILDWLEDCTSFNTEMLNLDLKGVSKIIDEYEIECLDKPWSRINLFGKLQNHLFTACVNVRTEARKTNFCGLYKKLSDINGKFGEKSIAAIEAAAADKKKFFDKYFNGECKLFDVLPSIESYE